AKIHRNGGAVTSIFRLINGQRVKLLDFDLEGEHSAVVGSTGSNPVAQIGDTLETDNTVNEDLDLWNLQIRGSNWAGIQIYGRRGDFDTVKNRRISIRHVRVFDRSNGIFIYKNAEDILLHDITTDLTAQDGVIVDTRAATD